MAKKNNEMTADDLMQLPDIDGLVLDVRGQQAQSFSTTFTNILLWTTRVHVSA